MKRWIVALTIMLCLSPMLFCNSKTWGEGNEPPSGGIIDPNQPAIDTNGWILSLMSMESRDPEMGNAFVRGGYKYGVLEVFGGVEAEKGKMYEFGFKLHSRDAIQQNSVPVLSQFLTSIFTEETVATGYTGLHWVHDRYIKEVYSGALVGIEAKTKPDSPVSIFGEVHYENNKAEDITYYFGLLWRF